MANINKLIELTLKNGDAGPYFDVYYSTDCNSYTICIDGTNVYLPNLSSTAIVTVPDNTTCMKLINKSAGCSNNDYIQVFGTTTTTTTCAPCAAYNILGNSSPWTVTFRDCFGQVQTVGASSTVDRTFCAQEVISASNTAYESAGRNCINGPCSGTSASINICDCDIQRLEVEPGVGNVSLISYIPCAQSQSTYAEVSYYGTTYYDVCIASGSWVLDPNKGETSYRGECSDCATTTTTTAAPTTTTTTLGCASCRNITFDGNITHASLWGYWTSCDGTPNSVFIPADTTYGPVCVQNGSAYGQAYTNGACCDPTTTTTTTTTAAPTTTTTTAAISYTLYDAEYYDCLDCGAGPVGTIVVAFDSSQTQPTLNRFYQPIGGPDGLAYKVLDLSTSGGPGYILTTAFGSATTCGFACAM